MKHLLTAIACLFAFTLSAQTFTLQGENLYMTKRGKTSTLAFVRVSQDGDKVDAVELQPLNGLFSPNMLIEVSDFLRQQLNLKDNAVISYGFGGEDVERVIIESRHEAIGTAQTFGVGKPALWRAGKHQLNAIGWGAGGTAVSVVVSIFANPILGAIIAAASTIGMISESVKSAHAIQEASSQYEAQFNELAIPIQEEKKQR
jgi:hypothetical protein